MRPLTWRRPSVFKPVEGRISEQGIIYNVLGAQSADNAGSTGRSPNAGEQEAGRGCREDRLGGA